MLEVNAFSSAGVIYQKSAPWNFFAEVKDGGYPVVAFRNHLCCIGGNWIGQGAKEDKTPLDTFLREVAEELSFDKPIVYTDELQRLGFANSSEGYQVQPCTREPKAAEIVALAEIKGAIAEAAEYFAGNVQTVRKVVFDRADPNNKRGESLTYNSFFGVPLSDRHWYMLAELSQEFGNLSNESISLMTDVDTLIRAQQPCSWGYDRILQRFFVGHCVTKAEDIHLVPDVEVVWDSRGELRSYEEILTEFNPTKRP